MDWTGSALAGATVTLGNLGTNRTRTVSSNLEGSFRAAELPVGQYELQVESSGFNSYLNNAIVVSIGRVVQVTVQLAPATVQQQITVSEHTSVSGGARLSPGLPVLPHDGCHLRGGAMQPTGLLL